jgi:hypothetical protein
MTRVQYIALCLIGGVAVVAFIESQQVKAALAGMMRAGGASRSGGATV